MAQMPEEGRKFGIVDSYWRAVMDETSKNKNCIVSTGQNNMLGRLKEANVLLEEIQKGLNVYLEKKRLYFPRLENYIYLGCVVDIVSHVSYWKIVLC